MNYKAIGEYFVYEDGRIVSAKNGKKRILKPMTTKSGYKWVQLRQNAQYKCYTVHRLVAELFLNNPEGLPEIDHIDGDKSNNKVSNLRWTTHKENCNNPNTVKNMVGDTPYHYKYRYKTKDGIIKEYEYVSL